MRSDKKNSDLVATAESLAKTKNIETKHHQERGHRFQTDVLGFELAIEPDRERPGGVALIGHEDVDTDRGTVIVG